MKFMCLLYIETHARLEAVHDGGWFTRGGRGAADGLAASRPVAKAGGNLPSRSA